MSAKKALDAFYSRQLNKMKPRNQPRRKRGKPEFELTVKPCMSWLKDTGFSMNRVEARAVFDPHAGRYLRGQTDAGFADAVGVCPCGTAAMVEFKAPGKRSSLKPHQRAWLVSKINHGAFAVCVDSVRCLADVWTGFKMEKLKGANLAKQYLIAHLPPEKPDPLNELFKSAG